MHSNLGMIISCIVLGIIKRLMWTDLGHVTIILRSTNQSFDFNFSPFLHFKVKRVHLIVPIFKFCSIFLFWTRPEFRLVCFRIDIKIIFDWVIGHHSPESSVLQLNTFFWWAFNRPVFLFFFSIHICNQTIDDCITLIPNHYFTRSLSNNKSKK